MKRTDFLKILAVPLIVPFIPDEKKEEDIKPVYKMRAGDIAYFDGKIFHPVNTAYSEQ
jgi:hypothetical protein